MGAVTGQINFSMTAVDTITANIAAGVLPITTAYKLAKAYGIGSGTLIAAVEGSYTPNTDLLNIWSPSAGQQPAIMILLTDKPIGLTITDTIGARVTGLTVDRMFVYMMQPWNNNIVSVFLDGKVADNVGPITLGSPVNYNFFAIQGSLN